MRSLLEKGMGLPPHRNATTREAAKDKEKMAVVNDDEKLADDKLSVSPSDPFRLANLEDGGGKEVMTRGRRNLQWVAPRQRPLCQHLGCAHAAGSRSRDTLSCPHG